jgi:hypothetical protein
MSSDDSALLASAALDTAADALIGLLPAVIRTADAAQGNALAAFIRLLASGSLELQSAIAQMADNAFVETADNASLDDIAQLVGATPLVPLPAGSAWDLRAYVANTLRDRAGKGTARALEDIAADVGGFGTAVVEYFQRLARCENLIDVRVDRPGVALPRPGVTAGNTATAWDRLPRLPDFRSISRAHGRHHVPNIGVHLLRPIVPLFPAPEGDSVAAAQIAGVPQAAPWTGATGLFRLSGQPDGVVRLFNPDRRSADNGARPTALSLPNRLARLPLHLETRALRRAIAAGTAALPGPWFLDDAPFVVYTSTDHQQFSRVPVAQLRIANLEAAPTGRPLASADGAPVALVIDPVTGRIATPAPGVGEPEIVEVRVAYGTGIGFGIGAGPQVRDNPSLLFDVIDVVGMTNFIRVIDATAPAGPADNIALRHVPDFAAALADWQFATAAAQWQATAFQRAIFVFACCNHETGAAPFALDLAPGVEHHLIAGQWVDYVAKPGLAPDPGRRGFIVRQERRAVLDAPLALSAGAAVAKADVVGSGTLLIDGLELSAGLSLAGDTAQSVQLRYCTVRQPGAAAVQVTGALAGGTLDFSQSILGPLALSATNATGSVALTDCIVAADGASGLAIDATNLDAVLTNVTVLGTSAFKSLEATNTVFADTVTVRRTQTGCVRFSYVHDAYAVDGSRVPRRFQCLPDLARAAAAAANGAALSDSEAAEVDLAVAPLFLDTALDEPTCAMLHPLASDLLRTGGEEQAEIGAFARAAAGLRMANIRRLFDEVLPFGLEAALIDDTRSTQAFQRRNVP